MVTPTVPAQFLGVAPSGGARGTWRMLDRDLHAEQLLEMLERGPARAALVVGPTGTGKRTLLDLLAPRVHGPVTHRLDGAERAAVRGLADLLDTAGRPAGRGAAHLVLVHDVDLLDACSRSLLDEMVARTGTQVVGAVRSHRLPSLLEEAPAWERVPQVSLPPLTLEETGSWCERRLAGELDPIALARIHTITAGIPSLVRDVVDRSLAERALVRRGGQWELAAATTLLPASPATRLLLAGLGCRQLDVLAYLGVARRCDLRGAERLFGIHALDALERAGLVTVRVEPGRHTVVPRAPWTPALLGQATAGPRRAAMTHQYLAELGRRPADEEDLRAVATIAATNRMVLDAPHLRRVTMAALSAGDVSEAYQLATSPGGSAELVGPVLAVGGQHHRAEEVLSGTGAVLSRVVNLACGQGDVAAAARLDAGGAGALLCHALRGGAVPTPGRTAGLDGQVRLLALAESALRDGRTGQALGLRPAEPLHPEVAGQLRWRIAELLLTQGRDEETRAAAAGLRRSALRAGNRSLLAAADLLDGRLALRRGRFQDARRSLLDAVAEGERGEAPEPVVVGAAHLAVVLAWLGDAVAAEAALTRAAEAVPAAAPLRWREELALCRAETLLLQGAGAAAVAHCLALAAEAEAVSAWSVAVSALELAGRTAPSGETAERMASAAAHCDHVDAASRTEYVAAAARQDPRALETAGGSLAAQGRPLLAAEASARAAAVWAAEDQHALARTAAARCAAVLEDLGVPRPWFWPGASAAAPLTPREQEIALLAARGGTSSQIARQLHLSVRTVENHLQHCYRKLAIEGRHELAGALAATTLARR